MYSNQLAAAIKAAGKVLREFDKDKVYLPFGSEYSIYLKNMNTVRAVAHVSIDGKDVGDGRGFVIPAKGSVDIERFIRNGNLEEGNRFKFIERTGKVEQHRGISAEDGLVEITFQFERIVVPQPRYFVDPHRNHYGGVFNDLIGSGSPLRGGSGEPYLGSGGYTTCSTAGARSFNADSSVKGLVSNDVMPQNETGVTAPGSLSDQQFSLSENFPLEWTKHTMVLQLLGETEDNRAVREAVTVKHKPKCVSCGTVNRYDAKFCSECGTSLQIV